MAKLGGAYIPNLGPSFDGAVTPSAISHYVETPAKVKIACEIGSLGGFTIARDSEFWGSEAFGVVAVAKEVYAGLPENLRSTTRKDAWAMAEEMNNPSSRPSITVKAATNQSKKF